MGNTTVTSGGVGLPGLLTVVFVVFKILGHIEWSWWWVFSPLWISFGLGMLIFILVLVFYVIAEK